MKKIFSRLWTGFKNTSKWIKLLLLLILCAAGFFGWKLWFKAPAQPQFRTAEIKKGDIEDIVEASGPLAPVTTTEVGALVSGEILKIYVDYNSEVKKGDLLALIDPTQIQTDYDQALASLSSAKESLESEKMSYNLAESNLKRYKALYAKNYVAKTDLEQYELAYVNAKSSLNSAESRVIQAQASLDRAKKDLDNTRIVSPIDGVVLTKKVSEGQSLTSGYSTPEMFTLAQDLSKMQIEAKISEADVVKIKEGQTARFTLDGYPDEKFTGVIRQVRTNYTSSSSSNYNNSSSSSTTYTVVIDVDNAEGKFKPGMTATITIQTADKKGVLLVPNEALRFSPSFNKEKFDTTGVWIWEEGKEPKREEVTMGIMSEKKTEISSTALKEGQKVIVSEAGAASTAPEFGRRRRR